MKNHHAVTLGKKGGKIGGRSRSPAKIATARTNGKKGGRPKKEARTLERELTTLTIERDQLRAEVERWQAEAEEMSAQRSHNANQAGRLRAEVERLKTCGITELAAINPSVADYCKHWEARAERAEAERDALAKDKARLDWLAVSDVWFDFPATGAFTPETMRAAIDAAMKGTT